MIVVIHGITRLQKEKLPHLQTNNRFKGYSEEAIHLQQCNTSPIQESIFCLREARD